MNEDPRLPPTAKAADRAYLDDPPQPALTGNMPRIKQESRVVDGVRFFAPHLPQPGHPVQILAVGVAPTPEEASSVMATNYAEHQIKPKLMNGPAGTIIGDAMDRFPLLQSAQLAYTVAVPWLLPKSRRFKPAPKELEWARPALHDFVNALQPEVIVAFGKIAFDQLVSMKINADDARGGWFNFTDTGIPVYLVEPVTVLLTQPWMVDTLITDFKEVERMIATRRGVGKVELPLDLREITSYEQLEAQVAEWEAAGHLCFSVDCEWAGNNHVDGRLRSIQFCWGDHVGCCLSFFDEHGTYLLGAEVMEGNSEGFLEVGERWIAPGDTYINYDKVGAILGRHLNRADVTYIGHHCSADSPWMEEWLGLDVLGKFTFDSEYGQQTVNEYSKLGLERMAMTYTSFGRYDMELVMWKRDNKLGEDDGYGKIPRAILVPYSILDVITVWRARPFIEAELERQETIGYFRSFIMPFVSDTFHTFTTFGLPVDRRLFELTRKFFNWSYRLLLADFRQTLAEQADEMVAAAAGLPLPVVQSCSRLRDGDGKTTKAPDGSLIAVVNGQGAQLALTTLCPALPANLLEHWMEIRNFNIRSAPQVRRWLFDLMGMTPVKTTSNKAKGVPAMLWEKTLDLPDKVRAALDPAVDKETMEILAPQDESGIINRLLAVSNVGNQCKGFLKEGEVDVEGEVVKENGLAKFITRRGRISGQYSLTETARPRSWKPNILNLSSYHNKGVEAGLRRILENPAVQVPAEFIELFGDEAFTGLFANGPLLTGDSDAAEERSKQIKNLIKKAVPTVRSTIKAPDGWCLTESDYKTAEIRAQAFKFNDRTLIRLMTEKDPAFGFANVNGSEVQVRIFFPDDAGIDSATMNPAFLLAYCAEDRAPVPVGEAGLLRGDDGEILHPPYDLHWSLAEMVNRKPREALSEKRDRGAGKQGNFGGAYGITGGTLERKIEAQTGIKPEPGTGEAILRALAERQPDVTAGLDDCAECPGRGEELVAASGRRRHFPVHSSELAGMPWRVRKSYLRAMGNEARNFYPQELVAATLARACKWLNSFYRSQGLQARVVIGLYDSCGTFSPLEERFVTQRAHTLFMDTINVWQFHGRWMSFPIDTDLNYRWSWKPTAAEKTLLKDPTWHPMDPVRQQQLMSKLDAMEEQFFRFQPHIKSNLNRV